MRESELLSHIARIAAHQPRRFPFVALGPGDDCALVRSPSGGPLLLTVDNAVEGLHFAPDTPIDLVARKAIARSISDVAAMGARPLCALAAAVLPTEYPHARELASAIHRWGEHFHCPVVGGDVSSADGPLVISVAVVGTSPEASTESVPWRPLTRSGARAGDELWVTGPLGASLVSGRHLRFTPRIGEGIVAAHSPLVHAMMDLSDGLGRDAARMAEASGVGIVLDASRLPRTSECRSWLGACRDGEDYELLIAAAPELRTKHAGVIPGVAGRPPVALIGPIGRVSSIDERRPAECLIFTPDGPHDAASMGWEH
ncbi:MAG: thiamine-phosphate kinase [Phycisphaerales bacterium]|jgi:thiamine-monophosphate kinase|nr:thiamine-phosphate kinase [Phycisphaerales bacterium]